MKIARIDGKGWKQMELTGNGWNGLKWLKWLKIAGNGWKWMHWLEMD